MSCESFDSLLHTVCASIAQSDLQSSNLAAKHQKPKKVHILLIASIFVLLFSTSIVASWPVLSKSITDRGIRISTDDKSHSEIAPVDFGELPDNCSAKLVAQQDGLFYTYLVTVDDISFHFKKFALSVDIYRFQIDSVTANDILSNLNDLLDNLGNVDNIDIDKSIKVYSSFEDISCEDLSGETYWAGSDAYYSLLCLQPSKLQPKTLEKVMNLLREIN